VAGGRVTPGPLVSVIIPTFNRAGQVREAVDSVLAQGVQEIEVVVVDDGSTDGTRAVLAGRDPRLVYAHQPNRGPAAARNRGIAMARGAFISFLDSDDLWLPGKLGAELGVFARLPSIEAVISDNDHVNLDGQVSASRFRDTGIAPPAGADLVRFGELPPLWIEASLFSTCCLTIRRQALARLGAEPFDTSVTAEDWDFELRMYDSCAVAFYCKVLARVRRFPDATRGARGMPTGDRRVTSRLQLERHHAVLCRAQQLGRLAATAREPLDAALRRIAAQLAAWPAAG
jgi:glycosyltransferase involved in cell wall biosynthesis